MTKSKDSSDIYPKTYGYICVSLQVYMREPTGIYP